MCIRDSVGLPQSLLWPGTMRWALVAAFAVLLHNAAKGRGAVPWPLGLASWLPLAAGVARADPVLLGVGAAAVVLIGLPGRGLLLPALVAAGLAAGGGDAARRTGLVATTEATLVRLDSGERLVVLGRLATWVGLRETLPGASLDLTDPSGEPAGSWGDATIGTEERPRELASRALGSGWQVAVLAPPPPHDLLAGLGAAGVAAPERSNTATGAPTSRGATFRPLSPSVVGRALAAGRGWLRVGVGEREFRAYFHARRDAVLVVPWVRPPVAEAGLMVAALTLWGLFPLTLWERRRRWLALWAQRRTFGGRMRVLSVAALPK